MDPNRFDAARREENDMKTKDQAKRPRSLGELIVSIYDDVSKVTDDVHETTVVTAREVTRWLIKTGRPDLALELAEAEG
jgi:hypothetical protein